MTLEVSTTSGSETAVATIRAAIDKLEQLRDAAAPGPWTAGQHADTTDSFLMSAEPGLIADTFTRANDDTSGASPVDASLELAAVMRDAVDPLLVIFWGALDAARNGRVVWGALPLARTILGEVGLHAANESEGSGDSHPQQESTR